jgi:hypothetical protein
LEYSIMTSLTGKQIANTYKDLLQVSNSNAGIDSTLRSVSDGGGEASPLQLSNAAVNIDGTFQLSGVTLTATASVLNAVADLTGATGMVAVSGGQVYGRTLTAGTGLSITNADGTEGNPTFSLNASGVVSGTYGPFSNFEVNQHGQVVSAATVNTSVSIPTLRADEIVGGTLTLSSKASIVGDLNVDGAGTIDGVVSLADDLYVSGSTYIGTNLSVTGNTRTDFLYAVSASIESAYIGTLTFTDVSTDSFTTNNLTVVSVVSVGTAIVLAGDNVATSAGLATVSSALATSIATANTRITSVSDYAVALSATFATSIATANTRITSVSDFAVALSATMATSIATANTRITSVSDFAVALSATFATSIATANTRITSVSDYTVALSATMATSIANHLRLAGGTLTGQLVGTSATFTGAVCATDYYGDGSNLTGISAIVSVNNDIVTDAAEYPLYVSATGTLSKLKTATSRYTFNPAQGTLTAFQLAASNGILLNSSTVTQSFTVPTGYNALSAGPLTIDATVTVVIPTSSTWMII